MTHRSFGTPHNERLEFLGDSVLNCSIATLLFERFRDVPEGALSRIRAHLVRQDALAELAVAMQLSEVIRLGDGEAKSGGLGRPSILADALEASLGAVYLDAGFDAAFAVVRRLYQDQIQAIDPQTYGKDAKTRLQEWCQGRRLPVPRYSVDATHGAAHQQVFDVICEIPERSMSARGVGASRRAAEQEAAAALLAHIDALDLQRPAGETR